MKLCKSCGLEKEDSEFNKNKNYKDKLSYECKKCRKLEKAKYYQLNKEKINNKCQVYYTNNSEYLKKYRERNKNKRREYYEKYEKERKNKDNLFKMKSNLRCLISKTFSRNGYKKNSHTYKLLNCSYEEFSTHFGPKPEGNYQIDHICPCAQAQNEEELIKLQHYSNLRWLSAEENLSKNNKRTKEAEDMCRILLCREWID